MTLHLDEFVRKPFVVQAARVTAENINEVATWSGGKIKKDEDVEGDVFYIQVEVKRPLDVRQTRAYVGDYVLSAGRSFKVYTEHAFKKSFDPHVRVNDKRPQRAPRPRPVPRSSKGPDLSPIQSVSPNQMALVEVQDQGFPEEPAEMREQQLSVLTPAEVQGVLSNYDANYPFHA